MAEAAIAALAFVVAAGAVFAPGRPLAGAPLSVVLLFTFLIGAYVALGVGSVVRALARALGQLASHRLARALAGPAVLWLAVLLYAATMRLPVAPRALVYAAYLAAPALLAAWPARPPGRDRPPIPELIAVGVLWLPVELDLLPSIPVPAGDGYDVARFVALVAGLHLFLVARPLAGIGYTFALRRREVATAVAAFLAYAIVALPIGFATGFIAWRPEVDLGAVVLTPVLIFLVTGVPEEFLFRGLIQNLLAGWWGGGAALAVASLIFGLAHLPDPRYVLLATLAGVAYGWVYRRTGRITAAAVTHALVDAVWVVLLKG